MASKTIIVPRVRRLYQGPSPRDGEDASSGIPEVPGYRILGRVASGGMGVVFAAVSERTHAKVALKLVRAEHGSATAVERIHREIDVLRSLHHPGIVRYVDHGSTAAGVPYLAMEWLDGIDLEARLRGGPLSLEDTLALAIGVSEALAAAHDQGVIHRDIKPGNIFLVEGRPRAPRLLDFGVARLSEPSTTLTIPGRIIGTPDYMSPEQARGGVDLDARADLFSLGCVLYECTSARRPFAGEHVMAVLAKVLMESPTPLCELVPEVPRALDELVARLLEKDPLRRLGSARELALHLRGLAAGKDERLPSTPEALTRDEQALRSVLFFRSRGDASADAPPVDLVQLAAEHLGDHVTLIDGTRLIVMDRAGEASDLAATAARCALALRERAPHFAIAVASGQSMVKGRSIMGQVLDRGAALLLRASAGHIGIDDVTTSLLDASFEVDREHDDGFTLVAVRELLPGARRLMGKATPLVGRSKELAFLEAAFTDCVEERCATAVVVVADAGGGKSRLRHELDARLQAHEVPVTTLIGRADPLHAQAPFSLLARVLSGAAGLEDGEPAAVRRHKLRARVSRYLSGADADADAKADVESVVLYLGEIVGAHPDDAPLELRLAREDSSTLRSRIQAAWRTWVEAETTGSPVLLVLEDLHWADAASVLAIDAILGDLEDAPLMVLTLARPSVYERFPSLWAEREPERLELPPLSQRAARKLVRQVLGSTVASDDVERIVAGARGNAFFLEELIRAAAEGSGDEIPDSVLGMMQARLRTLSTFERQVLRAASVFGETAWRGGIRLLLGREAEVEALGPTLVRLVDDEWLTSHPRSQIPSEVEYGFRHALVGDAAYATLTDADRRVGHRLAARWLERAGNQEAVVLAEHFQRGEDHAAATAWFAVAADRAFERHELDVVQQIVERGLDHAEPGEARGRLLLRRAEVHAVSGQHRDTAEAALAALEELPSGSPRWYAAAGEAVLAMGRSGQTVRVGRILDRLLATDLVSCKGAMGLVQAGVPLASAGEATRSRQLVEKIIELAATMTEDDHEAAGTMNAARTMLAIVTGDPSAYRTMEASAIAFERAGILRSSLEGYAGAGFLLLELGCIERGEALLQRTIERAATLRLEHVCAVARHNLGHRLAEAGRIDEGLELEWEALASFARHGNQRMTGLTRCRIAWILFLGGRAHDAIKHLDAALELLEHHPANRGIAQATRARVHLAQGNAAHALHDAQAAIEVLASVEHLQEGESLIRVTWAEALAAVGRTEEANAAILAAKRSLDERAQRIDDPQLRESFSTRLPENARIAQLARQWLVPDSAP